MPSNNADLGQNETNLGEVGLFRKNGKNREKMEMGKIWTVAAVWRTAPGAVEEFGWWDGGW